MPSWIAWEFHPRREDSIECKPVGASWHALDLVYGEFLLREELGEGPTVREYVQRFPPYADSLKLQIELHQAMASGSAIAPAATGNPLGAATGLTAGDATPAPQAAQTEPTVNGYEILGKLG